MKKIISSPYSKIFFLGLVCNLICAWLSEGYHYPDEHFQVLEFANYKSGNSPLADLPWEFSAMIRPAFLPFVAGVLIHVFHAIGILSPFMIAFLLRVIAATGAWFITSLICVTQVENFKTESGKRILVLMASLMWFVPYLDVRFSPENISAILFLCGMYCLLVEGNKNSRFLSYCIAGLLL